MLIRQKNEEICKKAFYALMFRVAIVIMHLYICGIKMHHYRKYVKIYDFISTM